MTTTPLFSVGRCMLRALIVFTAAITLASAGNAQQTGWTDRYGTAPGQDFAADIAIDAEGNVYVAGSAQTATSDYDIVTIKYSPNGIRLWTMKYSVGNLDFAADIQLDSQGNVIVAGEVGGTGGPFNYATIKYDTNGVKLWDRRYAAFPNGADDHATAMTLDGSDNIYVTGYSKGGSGNYDYATVKYDANGSQQWVSRYEGPAGEDKAVGIVVNASGEAYVTGTSASFSSGKDVATVKYSAAGVQQAVVRHDGPNHEDDRVSGIAMDSLGNVCISGDVRVLGAITDINTIKYAPDLSLLWLVTYDGPAHSYDNSNAITVDSNDNFIITGSSFDASGRVHALTIKYEPDGNAAWIKRYKDPGVNSNSAYAIAVDPDDNVYVAGSIFLGASQHNNFLTIKYSANGALRWDTTSGGGLNPGDDGVAAIAADAEGNVYVTGFSWGTVNQDILTIKNSRLHDIQSLVVDLAFFPSGSIIRPKATVSILGPAMPGGCKVNLELAEKSRFYGPATVLIPEGENTVTVELSTRTVAHVTNTTLTASTTNGSRTADLRLLPSGIRRIQFSPSAAVGGAPSAVTCTVTLRGPAPSGGAKVFLNSEDPSVSVPTQIVIPAGQVEGQFAVTTSTVTVQKEVRVWGDYGGGKWPGSITIKPPTLQPLRVDRKWVIGGSSMVAMATVAVSLPAPAGGLTVSLSSSHPGIAGLPTSVTIPAGATSVTIPVTHYTVATTTSVILTATFNGVSRATSLRVQP